MEALVHGTSIEKEFIWTRHLSNRRRISPRLNFRYYEKGYPIHVTRKTQAHIHTHERAYTYVRAHAYTCTHTHTQWRGS